MKNRDGDIIIDNKKAFEIILNCFPSNGDIETPKIDWKSVSHEIILTHLGGFLESVSNLLKPIEKCHIIHGVNEAGVDIILEFSDINLKICWQIKSYNDHQKKDFHSKTLAQITQSFTFGADFFILILATDYDIHKKKIRSLLSNVLKSVPNYVRIIEPNRFGKILNKENWPKLRARGLLPILGLPDEIDLTPEITSKDNDLVRGIILKSGVQIEDKNIKNIYDEGIALVANRDFDEAEKKFNEVLSIDPNIIEALNSLGAIELIREEWGSSIKYFQQVLLKNHFHHSTLINLSIAYRHFGCYQEALLYSEESFKIHSDDVDSILIYIKALRAMNQLTKARYTIQKSKINEGEYTFSVCLEFGAVFLFENRINDALKWYMLAIQKDKSDCRGYWGVGICYQKEGKLNEAISYLERANEFNPKESEIIFTLGNCLRDIGEPDKALLIFEKAMKLNPDAVGILGNTANIMRDLGKLIDALQIYDKLADKYPSDSLVWENRGLCLCKLGRFKEGLASFEISMKLKSENDNKVLTNAGICCIHLKEIDKAEKYLLESLKINENDMITHNQLGWLYIIKGDFNKCYTHVNRAIELKDDSDETIVRLSSCLIHFKQLDKASRKIKSLLDNNPDFAPAWGTLGVIYEDQEKWTKAKQAYKKALKIDPSLRFARKGLERIKHGKKK